MLEAKQIGEKCKNLNCKLLRISQELHNISTFWKECNKMFYKTEADADCRKTRKCNSLVENQKKGMLWKVHFVYSYN